MNISCKWMLLLLCLSNNASLYSENLYGDERLDGTGAFKDAKQKAEYWLPIAAYAGNIEKVKEFLADKPNVDEQHTWWREGPAFFALQAAVTQGNTEIVKLLLKHGANPNTASAEFYPKFDGAEQYNLPKAPAWINELNKSDPSGMSDTRVTPLMYAAKGGFVDIVKLLLYYDADTTIKNFGNQSAADYAGTNYEIKQLINAAAQKATIEKPTIEPSQPCIKKPLPIATQKPNIPILAKKSTEKLLVHELDLLIGKLQNLEYMLNN